LAATHPPHAFPTSRDRTPSRRGRQPLRPNAVSVWVKGLKVGYLSRDDARRYRPGLLALQTKYGKPIALAGAIVGGGIRADGLGRLGLFLDHDPADFGLRAPTTPTVGVSVVERAERGGGHR